MSRARQTAIVLSVLRIAYGASLMAAPTRLTRSWLGADGGRDGAHVAIRGLGARDALLHVGALAAAIGDAPVRPWLGLAIAGDAVDIAATFASRRGLPQGSPAATTAVAGASAALAAVVVAALER